MRGSKDSDDSSVSSRERERVVAGTQEEQHDLGSDEESDRDDLYSDEGESSDVEEVAPVRSSSQSGQANVSKDNGLSQRAVATSFPKKMVVTSTPATSKPKLSLETRQNPSSLDGGRGGVGEAINNTVPGGKSSGTPKSPATANASPINSAEASPSLAQAAKRGRGRPPSIAKIGKSTTEEDIAADLLSSNMKRTTSDFDANKDPSPRGPSKTGTDVVVLTGMWDGKKWSGLWHSTAMPAIESAFSFEPDLSNTVDEETDDVPCNICEGTHEKFFVFCDLCNGGFHTTCCKVPHPEEDEDWHCPNCTKVLAKYGHELPPSRSWKGSFQITVSDEPQEIKETFELSFKYSVVNDSSKQENLIADVSGYGQNKFGVFEIAGTLTQRTNKEFWMDCTKTYVSHWTKKRILKLLRRKHPNLGKEKPKLSRSTSGLTKTEDTPPKRNGSDNPDTFSTTSATNENSLKRKRSEKDSAVTAPRPSKALKEEKEITPLVVSTTPTPVFMTPDISDQRQSSDILQLRQEIASLRLQLAKAQSKKRTLVVTDMDCYLPLDNSGVGGNLRLPVLWKALESTFRGQLTWCSEAPRAPLETVLRVHELKYISSLLDSAATSDDDHLTLLAAFKAAGAVCLAARRIVASRSGELPPISALDLVEPSLVTNALCIVSPPGHSVGVGGCIEENEVAEPNSGNFNSTAIGAIYALENLLQRVAVIDFGPRPGLGTEDIIDKYIRQNPHAKESIFFGSVNQGPRPTTVRKAHKTCIRVEGKSDSWKSSFKLVLNDVAKFQPTLVFLALSFDGGRSSRTTSLEHSHFEWISSNVLSCCQSVVSVLEGGAHDEAINANEYTAHVRPFVSSE